MESLVDPVPDSYSLMKMKEEEEEGFPAADGVTFHWKDVTRDFMESTADLGELLHDDLFGLFEAMSAIEMMDPKMDAGMMCNRMNRKVMNFDQAVRAGQLKTRDLTCEERIGIIDDTLGCLVTWLEGHSLAQTVFTNLYLHNPMEVEDKCLKAFGVVILKVVDIIRDFVNRANVYEEEDFQPITYGYQLCWDTQDSKACAMIREVEDDLQRKLKSSKKSITKGQSNEEAKNIDDSHQEKDHYLSSALYVRVKFFRLFLNSLIVLKKEVFHKPQQPKNTHLNLIDDVDKYLRQCSEAFDVWQQTLAAGIEPELGVSSSSDLRADYPTIMGFEPLVNQRLLPPTFPRYTKMKTRKEAVEYMDSLITRLRHVCKIYEFSPFHAALDFMYEFSKSSFPSPCVLSRSVLAALYLPQSTTVLGCTPLSEFLKEAVRQFIKPPSLHQRSLFVVSNSQAKEYVDMFFTHCSRPMSSLLQINGHNRARQREKLAQILEELATLQSEAEKLDAYLNNLSQKLDTPYSHMGFYSTWVLYHILRVMIQYLLSGFELELYSTHEYPYIFWYLYEFLFGWIVSTLNRASNLILEQAAFDEQVKGRNAKKQSKQKKRHKQRPHFREAKLNQALQQLCGGFYKTVCAFKMEGKVKLPWSGLNSEQIRYEHRFSPFNSVLAPPSVSYSQYKEMTEQIRYTVNMKPEELYLMAYKCFSQAKELLEEISDPTEEILAYITIAKKNSIVIKLLLSGHRKDSKLYPEFDFSLHKNFPVIRIL